MGVCGCSSESLGEEAEVDDSEANEGEEGTGAAMMVVVEKRRR